MTNFHITFSNPWWLLFIIIPAVIVTLVPYFMLSRKYRRTRNRISSIVLHILVCLLSISVLSGMVFDYEVPNKTNEILFVVDVSETQYQSADARDNFLNTALDMGKYDDFKIGVIAFGFDQQYVVPLTYDVDTIYDRYKAADITVDTTATDIAAALMYAKDHFSNPKGAKIVLVTDGKETDEKAKDVIKTLAAYDVTVDVANVLSAYDGDDIQLIDIQRPDRHINEKEECVISVTLTSDMPADATIKLLDNGEVADTETDIQSVTIVKGDQQVSFKHQFVGEGLHEITFVIEASGDSEKENNTYTTYYYLEVFNKVLILESINGESDALVNILEDYEDVDYEVEVKSIHDVDNLPKTVDELCQYDQIILNNVGNKDLPDKDSGLNFIGLLNSYVYDCGGGVFTVGGNKEGTDEANIYNRKDMYNSDYQKMLPVQVIEYTPPIAVMVIIDRSGSMGGAAGESRLDYACAGASSCLDALNDRDYFGLLTLESDYDTILPLTPVAQRQKISEAILSVQESGATGGTVYPGAVWKAGTALRDIKNSGKVNRCHIILVTDGGVPESEREEYEGYIRQFYEIDGITFSVVLIGVDPTSTGAQKMEVAVEIGHGRLYASMDNSKLITAMREDLCAPDIKEVTYQDYYPVISNNLSTVVKGIETGGADGTKSDQMTVTLGGYYGVKVKSIAETILSGEYGVPIYAQWKYGKGMVGSFMCDLNGGAWSEQFVNDANGKKFVANVINALMPTENIRPNEINIKLKEDNYTNTMDVFPASKLGEGESIQGTIYKENSEGGEEQSVSLNQVTEGEKQLLDFYVTTPLSETNNYGRCNFIVKASGVYRIELRRIDADGNQVGETSVYYKAFSYSQEYNRYLETEPLEITSSLKQLAESTGSGSKKGSLIEDLEDPKEIFANFSPTIAKSFDPRFLFMILAIIFFLLDIAARKFKFKWPHEIVRDYKRRKEEAANSAK